MENIEVTVIGGDISPAERQAYIKRGKNNKPNMGNCFHHRFDALKMGCFRKIHLIFLSAKFHLHCRIFQLSANEILCFI